jgi:hypothetical protein
MSPTRCLDLLDDFPDAFTPFGNFRHKSRNRTTVPRDDQCFASLDFVEKARKMRLCFGRLDFAQLTRLF